MTSDACSGNTHRRPGKRQRQDSGSMRAHGGFYKTRMTVRACKCGPDYIDPMFHREVLGMDSRNPGPVLFF